MTTKKTTKKQAIKLKDLPAKDGKDVKGGKALPGGGLEVKDGRAVPVPGGCEEFGCGTNHNETLLSELIAGRSA